MTLLCLGILTDEILVFKLTAKPAGSRDNVIDLSN